MTEQKHAKLSLCCDTCLMLYAAEGPPVAHVFSGEIGDATPVIRVIGDEQPGSCTGELRLKATVEMIAYEHIDPEVARGTAERLRDCWNACSKIHGKDLADGVVPKKQAREAILALRYARDVFQALCGHHAVSCTCPACAAKAELNRTLAQLETPND